MRPAQPTAGRSAPTRGMPSTADNAFTYGADYPGTKFDYGQATQFATTPLCGGPFGPDSTFCDTVLSPTP